MKDTIQQTSWSLSRETGFRFGELGFNDVQVLNLNYGDSRRLNRELYVGATSSWSQEFLPQLSIGNATAMMAQYDVTNTYPKFGLIIDLSRKDFNNHSSPQFVPLTPAINHLPISIDDTGKNFNELLDELRDKQIFQKITEARNLGQKVLINCLQGDSVSATVAILYMMETYGVSLLQAYHHLEKCRPLAEPNPGYFSALMAYEATLNVEPVPFKAAQAWMIDFLNNTSSKDFIKSNDDNQTITWKFRDPIRNSSKRFIDLISFLKLQNIPFNTLHCGKLSGAVQMSIDDAARFEECLVTKKFHVPIQETNGDWGIEPLFAFQTINENDIQSITDAMNLAINSMGGKFFVTDHSNKHSELVSLQEQFIADCRSKNFETAFATAVSFAFAASEARGGCMNFFKAKFGETKSAKAFYHALTQAGLGEVARTIKAGVENDYEDEDTLTCQ